MWKGEPAAENVGMEECVNEGVGMRSWGYGNEVMGECAWNENLQLGMWV